MQEQCAKVSTLMHMCIVVIAGPDGNDGTPERKLVKQNVAIQVELFSHQRNINLSICFILVGFESIFFGFFFLLPHFKLIPQKHQLTMYSLGHISSSMQLLCM